MEDTGFRQRKKSGLPDSPYTLPLPSHVAAAKKAEDHVLLQAPLLSPRGAELAGKGNTAKGRPSTDLFSALRGLNNTQIDDGDLRTSASAYKERQKAYMAQKQADDLLARLQQRTELQHVEPRSTTASARQSVTGDGATGMRLSSSGGHRASHTGAPRRSLDQQNILQAAASAVGAYVGSMLSPRGAVAASPRGGGAAAAAVPLLPPVLETVREMDTDSPAHSSAQLTFAGNGVVVLGNASASPARSGTASTTSPGVAPSSTRIISAKLVTTPALSVAGGVKMPAAIAGEMSPSAGNVRSPPSGDHITQDPNAAQPDKVAEGKAGELLALAIAGQEGLVDTKLAEGVSGDLVAGPSYSRPRQFAIQIATNPDFELFVIIIIFANCITLAMHDPLHVEGSARNHALFIAEAVLNGIFTVEMFLRIVAIGGPFAYLKESWNQFDCFMVLAGYTAFIPTGDSNTGVIRALRAMRALRPLRTITRFESLRSVVVCFMEAVPLLLSVTAILLFFMLLYAIAGIQLFQKVYHEICVDAAGNVENAGDDPDMFGCGGWRKCPSTHPICKEFPNNTSINCAGFDNVGMAMLMVFQSLTLTGWSFMMYRTMDATNPAAALYYFTLVCLGAYFVINLFLAVLKTKFAKAQTLFHAKVVAANVKTRKSTVGLFMGRVQSKWSKFAASKSQLSKLNSEIAASMHSRASAASGRGSDSIHKASPRDQPRGSPTASKQPVTASSASADAQVSLLDSSKAETKQHAGTAATAEHRSSNMKPVQIVLGQQPVTADAYFPYPLEDTTTQRQSHSKGKKTDRSLSDHSAMESPASQEGLVGSVPPARTMPSESRNGAADSTDSTDAREGSAAAPVIVAGASGARASPGAAAAAAVNGSRVGGASRLPSSDDAEALRLINPDLLRDVSEVLKSGGSFLSLGSSAYPSAHPSEGNSPRSARSPSRLRDPSVLLGTSAGPVAEGNQFASSNDGTPGGASGVAPTQPAPLPHEPPKSAMHHAAPTDKAAKKVAVGKVGEEKKKVKKRGIAFADGTAPASSDEEDAVQLLHAATSEGHHFGLTSKASEINDCMTPLLAANSGGVDGNAKRRDSGLVPAASTVGLKGQAGDGADAGAIVVAGGPGGVMAPDMAMLVLSAAEFDEFVADRPFFRRQFMRLQFRCRLVCNHPHFNNFFMLTIALNTILLALEYDNMPQSMSNSLANANIVLTVLFTVEMSTKLLGLGFWDYIMDGWNIFDAVVVTTSWLEIILTAIGGLNSLRTIRALRILKALRVLRLLKLFKYLSSLRKIGEVLLSAFTSFFAILVLLTLFWLVFSIMGLHVFGGSVIQPAAAAWPNFDTFLFSLTSTFNIVNLENYQNQMWGIVRVTNQGAVLYFMVWIIIGKYILLHLFLAVTLEAFEAKYDADAVAKANKGTFGIQSIMASMRSAASSARSLASRGSRQSQDSDDGHGKGAAPHKAAPSSPRVLQKHDSKFKLGGIKAAGQLDKQLPLEEQGRGSGGGARSNSGAHDPATAAVANQALRTTPQRRLLLTQSSGGSGGRGVQPGPPITAASLNAHMDNIKNWVEAGSGNQAPLTALPQTYPANSIPDLTFVPSRPVDSAGSGEGTILSARRAVATLSTGPHLPPSCPPLAPAPAPPPPALSSGAAADSAGSAPAFSPQLESLRPLAMSGDDVWAQLQRPGSPYGGGSGCSNSEGSPNGAPSGGSLILRNSLSARPPTSTGISGGSRPTTATGMNSPSATANPTALPQQQQQWSQNASSPSPYGGRETVSPGGMRLDIMSRASMYEGEEPHVHQSSGQERSSANKSRLGPAQPATMQPPGFMSDPASTAANTATAISCPLPDPGLSCATYSPSPHPDAPYMPPCGLPTSLRISASGAGEALDSLQHSALDDSARRMAGRVAGPFSAAAADGLESSLSIGGARVGVERQPPRLGGSNSPPGTSAVTPSGVTSWPSLFGDTTQPARPLNAHSSIGQLMLDQSAAVVASADAADAVAIEQRSNSVVGSLLNLGGSASQVATVVKGSPRSPVKKACSKGDLGKQASTTSLNSGRQTSTQLSAQLSVISDMHSDEDGHSDNAPKGDVKKKKRRKSKRKPSLNAIPIAGTGKAFWIWDEDHPTRERVYEMVTDRRFDYFMFVIILLNCLEMAFESPSVVKGSIKDQVLYWSNFGFTLIFCVEVVLKCFAFTCRAYIRQLTNKVDVLIVVTSLLDIILAKLISNISAINALRALRALKPLRMLTRSAGMRLVFKSVTMSLVAMGNVSIVCILFFLIFAILGVNLFAGRFYTCNDTSVANKGECNGTYVNTANVTVPRHWANQFPNFDNTGQALMVCFVTATLNGYTQTMINAMSAPAIKDDQPVLFSNPGAFFWFLGFVVICAYTLLNLYVGVIFSQFSRIRQKSETGSAFLTGEQNEWAELSKMVFKLKPPDKSMIAKRGLRRTAYKIAVSNQFDLVILVAIMANVALLASTYYGEDKSLEVWRNKLNYFFTAVFVLEAMIKIVAFSWKGYIKVAWNKFDFLLAAFALMEIALAFLHSSFLRILRAFRAVKMLSLLRSARTSQLIKSLQGMKSLFATLITSLPAFGNVGALIGLVFFIYAYIGVFLLGKVMYHTGVNQHTNFRNFLYALQTLFRVATGDNWVDILQDLIVQPPKCQPELHNCGTYLAVPFLLSFYLVVAIILLNLFTAVIIETFEKTHSQEDWKLGPQALDDFVTLWSEYDDGSGTILPKQLEELLLKLEPPLGLGPLADGKDVLRFVYDLEIPLINGRVPFHKTAFELVKRCSQASIPEGAIKDQIDRLVNRFFKDMAMDEMINFSVAVTVNRVQRKWRTRMRAAKLKRRLEWIAERKENNPLYMEVWRDRALLDDRMDEARAGLREDQKRWEALQVELERKYSKADAAKKFEPRWRFTSKYAPFPVAEDEGKGANTGLKATVGGMMQFMGSVFRVKGDAADSGREPLLSGNSNIDDDGRVADGVQRRMLTGDLSVRGGAAYSGPNAAPKWEGHLVAA